MKKVAIIYWSGTGNTEEMANLIAKGANANGADVKVIPVGNAKVEDATEEFVY